MQEKHCRICLGSSQDEEMLLSPCKCCGTMEYAHNQCLMNWYTSKLGVSKIIGNNSVQCEICHYNIQYTVEHARKNKCNVLISSIVSAFFFVTFIFSCGVICSVLARDFTTSDPIFSGVSSMVKLISRLKPKPTRDRNKCYPHAIDWNVDPCGENCFVIYYSSWNLCVETNRTRCNGWDNKCFHDLDKGTNTYFRTKAQEKCYQYWTLRLTQFTNPYVLFDIMYLGTVIACFLSCRWRFVDMIDFLCMISLGMELTMSMISMVVVILDDDFTLTDRCIFSWRTIPFSLMFSTFYTMLSSLNFLYPSYIMYTQWHFFQHRVFVALVQDGWRKTIYRFFGPEQESSDAKFLIKVYFENMKQYQEATQQAQNC